MSSKTSLREALSNIEPNPAKVRHRLSFILGENVKQDLKRVSKQLEISESEFIRQSVIIHLRAMQRFPEQEKVTNDV